MKTLRFPGLVAIIPLAVAAGPQPAAAGSSWHFGSSFHLGGVDFAVGYHDHRPDHYVVRTRIDLGRRFYGRAHHYDGCSFRDGYHYHGASCPLVRDVLYRHGTSFGAIFSRYGPRRIVHHPDRYGDRYRYGRSHRGFDRRHDHRGYRHHDRHYRSRHRDHGRRDPHHGSCGRRHRGY